ncbi:MAG: HAD family phosphatase [Nocardioides sp.]
MTPSHQSARVESVVPEWAARPGRAVIFDFNGTLSDDEPILEAIFIELFAEHLGWTMDPEEYRHTLLGHSDREIVQIAVARHLGGGAPEPMVDHLLARRRERYRQLVAEHSPILPATVELVERLAAAGVPMAIVTGAQRPDVEAVLAASPAGPHIRAMVTEEDVRVGKPDPEGFLRGARLLGVEPSDVLVFEDSIPGVTGALAAHMHCVAVIGPHTHPDVARLAPAWVRSLSVDVLAGSGI